MTAIAQQRFEYVNAEPMSEQKQELISITIDIKCLRSLSKKRKLFPHESVKLLTLEKRACELREGIFENNKNLQKEWA